MICPSCTREAPDSATYCPSCGFALKDVENAATVYIHDRSSGGATSASTRPHGRADSSRAAAPRFATGDILAGRFRLISLLGRGGMGDVYRADDLSLGHPVALKFLPDDVASNPERLGRFRGEVRVARQVSHPNVCRVYDITEAEGLVFLSMEYIDGEDLATLLRRIGRLASDKAVEMARGLCAGLAAAHDKGVLHRDLKPANVMIDGMGHVRLADFGLAGGDTVATAGLAGTPAYMAPEQFDGKPATVRSDIYALGLVLYEMFTGTPAFTGKSVHDLARQHRETTPTSVTKLIADSDPLIDRIIQRCLAKDPADRPASALTVAAALPGGDPLAAALAAGETPSPAMVAAAGGVGALRPVVASALLASVLIGLAIVVWLSTRTQGVHYLPMERAPAVLADAAGRIVQRLGFVEPPVDEAWGFTPTDYIRYIEVTDQSPDRWQNLRPGQPPGVTFWYRQAPTHLFNDSFLLAGRVTLNDPPPTTPGMVNVMLDLKGRLHYLAAETERLQRADASAPEEEPDWSALFREAGFDEEQFTAATPLWVPPVFADARAAWTGAYPDRPDVAIRVEAAAMGGRPVYFQIFEPWSAETIGVAAGNDGPDAAALFGIMLPAVVLVGALLLARRNLRLGRGDLRGATAIALTILVVHIVAGLLVAHHTFDPPATLLTLGMLVSRGLALGMLVHVVYVALEPDVRRRWPATLIGWSRVLTGRWRDPLVGRDLLVGAAVGVLAHLLTQLERVSPAWVGGPPTISRPPVGFDGSLSKLIASVLDQFGSAVPLATLMLLAFFLLFLVFRRLLAATSVFVALLLAYAVAELGWSIALVFAIAGAALYTVSVARLGLLTLVVAIAVSSMLDATPLTFDASQWFGPASYGLLLFVAAVAAFGFRSSLADKPMFDSRLLD